MCRRLISSNFILITILLFGIPDLLAQSKIRFENYTLDDGLPHNIANCTHQDNAGWIWIGTERGLCRFDGESFRTYLLHYEDPENESSHINCLYEDKNSDLWIGTEDAGLAKYDRKLENFSYYLHSDSSSNCISSNYVYSIAADTSGILWLGTDNGLNRLDPKTKEFKWYGDNESAPSSLAGIAIQKVFMDSRERLWIGSIGNGLYYLDAGTTQIRHFNLSSDGNEDIQIIEITEDSKGRILLGTFNEGLLIIDPVSGKFLKKIILEPEYQRSFVVRGIAEDKKANLWLGTRGGVYILDPDLNILAHYVRRENDPWSLSHLSVNHILEDMKGDIWISTRNGISHVIQEKQVFKYYGTDLKDSHYLNNSEIYSIYESREGKIWIGTEAGGINILDNNTGRFRYLLHDENNENSLSSNCIKSIIQDRQGDFWIGTYLGGVNYYDADRRRFTRFMHNPEDNNSISDNRVWALHEDSKGNIWIGSTGGLDMYDPESRNFFRFTDSIQNKSVYTIFGDREGNLFFGSPFDGLSIIFKDSRTSYYNIPTRVIFQDSKGRIWLGSDEYFGLHRFDPDAGIVKTYTVNDGLPSNQILGILEDDNEQLWISTGQGLSLFDPATGKSVKNFRKEDGIQGNRFYYGAYCKSRTGELFFGGQNGLSSFYPGQLAKNTGILPVYITGIKIFNRDVPIGSEFLGKTILEKSISYSEEIELNYAHSVFTLEFVALNYVNSSRNKYAYYLEGFEDDWNYVGSTRSATYTNLNPGKYTFRVKASNNEGVWNQAGISLGINIKPPIWRTTGFKLLVITLLIGIIYLIISFFIKREMLKNQLVLERIKSKELHKIDMMKFQFFTNISHEIRTPISLIVSPLKRIKNSNLSVDQIRKDLDVVYRNALRLGKLVDQLLDYRKIEAGKLKLELSRGDIVSFLKNVLFMFRELSEEKNIRLELYSVLDQIQLFFDPDKIEKVMFNLLSNSFKYTPGGGSISVAVSLTYQMNPEDTEEETFVPGEYVQIVVKDSGSGIPENKKDKIFDRFYQGISSKSAENPGSGIGLSLSRELIKIHNGKISLKSKEGSGTEITILLPAIKEEPRASERSGSSDIKVSEGDFVQVEDQQIQEKLLDCETPVILVMEDNKDLLGFIKSIFEDEYNVITAEDGESGLELAFETIPDLIISDIMMPKMDGKKFGKNVKQDFRTSHIPLVYLTALSSRQHEKEGILLGADEYITKPFDPQLLKVRVEQLLATRRMLRDKYSRDNILQYDNLRISAGDDKFLQKLVEIIEENIADPEFGTIRISREVGVSRTQLYRKMAALTDMTVKEFIRSIRLKRAARMLLTDKLNISEVAYSVGFQQAAYFRKCFRDLYGMTPTEYIRKNSAKIDDSERLE